MFCKGGFPDAGDFSRPCGTWRPLTFVPALKRRAFLNHPSGTMKWKSSRHWIFQSRVRQGTEVHGTGKFREPAGWKACATRFGDFPGQCQ